MQFVDCMALTGEVKGYDFKKTMGRILKPEPATAGSGFFVLKNLNGMSLIDLMDFFDL